VPIGSGLKRMWARSVGDDVAGYFPFALHRAALGLLLAIALVAQTVLSIDGARPDALVDGQLLANESDANSVVAVQRESFNVALALSDWGHGAATTREVLIARALLSQRLTVVTRSRTLTADNVGADYLAALDTLDTLIMSLADVADDGRSAALADAEPVVDAFLSETRSLNEIFQRLGREQVQMLLEANRERQRLQTVLQLTIILLIGLLSLSIVVALGRGYRKVTRALVTQRREVERARRELDLVRDLDAGIAPLLRAIETGAPDKVVRAGLEGVLDGLRTGHRWTVPEDGQEAVVPRVVPRAEDRRDGGTLAEPLDAAALDLIASRAQVVLAALATREEAVRAAEAARRRDPLTGLPNRVGFLHELGRMLGRAEGRPVAIALLDIDRFGEVNGALGFAGADRVLIEVAERLRGALAGHSDAIIARMAADEYAVAVPLTSEQDAALVVDGLRAAGTYLSRAGGIEAAISVSVGETVGTGGETDASELMRQAAVAMLLAKDASDRRGRVRFDPDAHDHLASLLVDELAVRNALRSGEFVMHYQPIVDLATARPVGLEALVRWDRPGVGLVPPGEFLPIVERSGFIVEFGFEVLAEVVATWKRSLRTALVGPDVPTGYVSVNIDAAQLADPGFEAFVLSTLERHAMEPRELVLELTEHAAIDRAHAPMLERLRQAGVRVAIDDFGSGFSSLGQSTRLPVDLLKLDRSFVASMLESDHDVRLFADLARLASTLDMDLIAEGIETDDVAQLLLTSGIVTGQGFLYSPALPESDAVHWIVERSVIAGSEPSGLADVIASGG
jgi:diguanylate cyclase (GGDEF)-like protein